MEQKEAERLMLQKYKDAKEKNKNYWLGSKEDHPIIIAKKQKLKQEKEERQKKIKLQKELKSKQPKINEIREYKDGLYQYTKKGWRKIKK